MRLALATLGKWIVYTCLLLSGFATCGAASDRPTVILYTKAGCRPCRQALESLRELGIEPTVTQDCPSWVTQTPTIHWRDRAGVWRQHAPSHWSGKNWSEAETAKIRRWLLIDSATKSTGRGGYLTVTSDSLPAPYYQRGPVTLYHGDCLELLPHLPRVDAVVTDPPYGIRHKCNYGERGRGDSCGKRPDGKAVWKNPQSKSYPDVAGDDRPFDPTPLLPLADCVVLWGGNHFADKLPASGGWLVWDKERPDTLDQATCELAWTNCVKGVRRFRHLWHGMMRASEHGEKFHPMQKPAALYEWILSLRWIPSGLVFDPFCGCGPCPVACIRTGNDCIGVELEERYLEIAAKRCDRELDQGRLPFDAPKRVETQRELFAEVARG